MVDNGVLLIDLDGSFGSLILMLPSSGSRSQHRLKLKKMSQQVWTRG